MSDREAPLPAGQEGICKMDPSRAQMAAGLSAQKLLPGTDCRQCGKRTCLAFAIDLARGKRRLDDCPPLRGPAYAASRQALARLLAAN